MLTAELSAKITTQPFGQLSNGQSAELYTLTNTSGMQVSITNYGGIIVSLYTPDKTGRLSDIVLGYDNVADYESDTYYLGAVIGRYAGRIADGKIKIDGVEHQLTLNAPDSQLHGGINAFNKVLWQAQTSQTENALSIELTHTSPDGDNGFPGTLQLTVTYSLTNDNRLIIDYQATTNKTTLLNLTQHSYFNLAGHDCGDVSQHQVQIGASHFLPMNEKAYPTGEIMAVKNTSHDFTGLTPLVENINNEDQQIKIGKGFDNYWLLNEDIYCNMGMAAQVVEPVSGRTLSIATDQPSMILYTGNYIDGSHYGKNNTQYQKRAGLCLEPQRANNRQSGHDIKNTLLTPDEVFSSRCVYQFGLL